MRQTPVTFVWLIVHFYFHLSVAAASIFGQDDSYPTTSFYSSKLRAPIIEHKTFTSACTDGGYYFIAPHGHKVSKPGPMILGGNGSLVWAENFSNRFSGKAYDLRVQEYRGEPYLTFWLGDDRVRGHGAGHFYMLNSSYDIVHKVGAANGRFADLHEFSITPDNTALLIVYESIRADVRPVGRPYNDLWNQAAYDCVVQEVDIATDEAVFEWRASQHVNMTLSYSRIQAPDHGTDEKPFDFIHLNSVDRDSEGNYLISGRNTHAVVYVDGKTGEIIWTLGGKANDFQDLSGGHVLNMAWQHDARFVSPAAFSKIYKPPKQRKGTTTRLMTIFDNAALDWNYDYGPTYSRGLLVEVTFPTPGKAKKAASSATVNAAPDSSLSEKDSAKVAEIDGKDPAFTVRLIHDFVHPDHVRSSTQGSVQTISHKDETKLLVSYGINPVMTEFSADGKVLCDMHFGSATSWETGNVQSYRAYKFPWIGRPRHPPSAVVRKDSAYVSWNGATEVQEWLLQSSGNLEEGQWIEVVKVPKMGFETEIPLPGSGLNAVGRYVRLLAIDQDGKVCQNGISPVVDRSLLRHLAIPGKLHRLKSNSMLLNVAVLGALGTFVLGIFVRFLRRRRARGYSKATHHAD